MRNGNDNAALVERLEHIERLLADAVALARGAKSAKRPVERKGRPAPLHRAIGNIDYSTNIRAFVRRHSAGMSGPKKFALLLAYLSKGDSSKRISLDEVQKQWNRMTAKGLLGMKFNRFYPTTAKERDWVSTEKNGVYHLRPSWKEIFNE